MKIHVTQKHIDEGLRECTSGCPVALALTESTGNTHRVTNHYSAHHTKSGVLKRRSLPRIVQIFIKNFDSGLPVAPFTFDADLNENNLTENQNA